MLKHTVDTTTSGIVDPEIKQAIRASGIVDSHVANGDCVLPSCAPAAEDGNGLGVPDGLLPPIPADRIDVDARPAGTTTWQCWHPVILNVTRRLSAVERYCLWSQTMLGKQQAGGVWWPAEPLSQALSQMHGAMHREPENRTEIRLVSAQDSGRRLQDLAAELAR